MFNEIMQHLQAGKLPSILALAGQYYLHIGITDYEVISIDNDGTYQCVDLVTDDLNATRVRISIDDDISKADTKVFDMYHIYQAQDDDCKKVLSFSITFA